MCQRHPFLCCRIVGIAALLLDLHEIRTNCYLVSITQEIPPTCQETHQRGDPLGEFKAFVVPSGHFVVDGYRTVLVRDGFLDDRSPQIFLAHTKMAATVQAGLHLTKGMDTKNALSSLSNSPAKSSQAPQSNAIKQAHQANEHQASQSKDVGRLVYARRAKRTRQVREIVKVRERT